MKNKVSEIGIDQLIEFLENSDISEMITCSWIKEPQKATFCGYPDEMDKHLFQHLRAIFPNGLYMHQIEAINSIQKGENVLITTGTSSGKSLCYQLPILDAAIKNRTSTSLLLFPTKALAEDQFKKISGIIQSIEKLEVNEIIIATYDGDTSKSRRVPIRNSANILLTNPDMLHLGILPQHTSWERLLSNLRFIVIDEVHTYRGVFGSHFSNILRRLKRILKYYGCAPQFVLASATISNGVDFAKKLIEEEFTVIDKDCSFQERRHYYFINPPVIDHSLGLRKSLIDQTLEIAVKGIDKEVQSILFSRTRKTVEISLKRLRKISSDSKKLIRGYRSGYLSRERRFIEDGLRTGVIRSIISTSALEMGVDMGKVDLTILMGYPGSISSFFQQSGRAGRRNANSASILIASSSPIDQYIIRHCDFVASGSPEHALIDPDNPLILLAHLKCAAYELPFTEGGEFGGISKGELDEYLNVLILQNQIINRQGNYYWISDEYPSAKIALRNISGNPIAIRLLDGKENRLVGEVDFQSALRTVHPGAVYIHDGDSFLVDKLDLKNNTAWLSNHKENYFTEHRSETKISLEKLITEEASSTYQKSFGELLVSEQVKGYKRIDWETFMPLGVYEIEGLPPNNLHTKGIWVSLSGSVVESLRNSGQWKNDANDYGNKWAVIRSEILNRDRNVCQVCGIQYSASQLHVHHKVPFKSFRDSETANHASNLITLCSICHRKAEQNVKMRSGLSGAAYLFRNIAPLRILCDHRDIGFFSEPESEFNYRLPVIAIYDQFPGGIGLSAKLFEFIDEILAQCLEVILQCPCDQGCPSCVGPAGEKGIGGKEPAKDLLALLLKNNINHE